MTFPCLQLLIRIVRIPAVSYVSLLYSIPLSLYGGVFAQAGDEFTSELVRIHETIEAEGGPRQPVCLAINRSDYMLHAPQDGVTAPHLLQVSQADFHKYS